MDKDRKSRIREMLDEARNAFVGAAAGAGAAAASGAPAAMIVAGAAIGAAPSTLSLTVKIARTWKEREAQEWWHNVLYGKGQDEISPEQIAAIIDEHQDKPFVRETIMRSLRALYDTPDQCAVAPLAMLAREYISERKAPDYFFRGVCDLLVSCSRSEFEELQAVLETARLHGARWGVLLTARSKPSDDAIGVFADNKNEYVSVADSKRFIRRLVRHELLEENLPTSADELEDRSVDGWMPHQMVQRLTRILLTS